MTRVTVKKLYSILLLAFCFALVLSFCACEKAVTVPVAVTDGAHYSVSGESLKQVELGESVSFTINIDAGYEYVSNSANAVFSNGVLTVEKVTAPTTVTIELAHLSFTVLVRGSDNENRVTVNYETAEDDALNVFYGENATFEIEIDQRYGYTGNSGNAVYSNGVLTVENVTENKEILIYTSRTHCKVTLLTDSHCSTEETEVFVLLGGDVTIALSFDEGYLFYGCDFANSYFANNTLTINNVSTDCTVNVSSMEEPDELTITLQRADGFSADVYSQTVEEGESAVFLLDISDDFVYEGNNLNGVYDSATGTLTIANVTQSATLSLRLRQEYFYVTLTNGENFTVEGSAQKRIKRGEDAVFEITVDDDCEYAYNNANASFSNGVLTIENVMSSQIVEVVCLPTTNERVYLLHGYYDKYQQGASVSYTAYADEGYFFTYWEYVTENNVRTIFSYGNNATFLRTETPSLTAVFASEQTQKIVYHANGGTVSNSTDTTVNVSFTPSVYLYSASLGERFFTTFEKTNHVPLEYNTAADGSGVAISLGSRVFSDEATVNLYVIWSEETSASDFSYGYLTDAYNNRTAVALTEYNGNATTVTLPCEIENLPVTTVERGCFTDNENLRTLVTNKNIKCIENGAVSNCAQFTTFYLCDSVESISDGSFVNCDGLSALRMIAVLPPAYSEHLIAATVRRIELLYKTRNDAKRNMLFYGGSGMFHAIDGQTLYDAFDGEYTVINCGQNANISGLFMLNVLSAFMREGDIMVYAPEMHERINSTSLHMVCWVATEAFYDAWRCVNLRNYENVFSSFNWYQNGEDGYTLEGKLNIVKNGAASTYEKYNDSFDEYFTRNYVDYYNGSYTLNRLDLPLSDMLKSLEFLKTLYQYMTSSNDVKFYFAASVLYEYGYSNDDSEIDNYYAALKYALTETVDKPCPFITEWRDYLYPREDMYDDQWHLTTEGASKNSQKLAQAIKEQLARESGG